MKIEHGQFVPERNLEGFKLSPNTAASQLEVNLGITFPTKPAAILLNGKNRFIYAVRCGVIPSIAAAILRRGDAVGKYDYRYHAFFAEKDSNLFTALHENMHGFNAVVNPDIPRQQDIIAKVIAERFAGRVSTQVNIEESISFRSFDEGMAQWAALETASHLPEDFDLDDLTSMKNQLLQGQDTGDQIEIDENFINREFYKLEEAKKVYGYALSLSGVKAMTEGAKAEIVMSDSLYITGFYFTYLATAELLRLGINIGDVINTLVKNPPSKIVELRNPVNYVCNLR